MTELPGGTVTFLFTDIEGSTRLERELRERYGQMLGDHRLLLREAFARYGGREIDTQGDSFFFVFPRARDAVAAAVAAQQALAEHEWPDGHRARVRIGMHTGEATLDEGRYVGLAVHRGARISAAGHGGQILLSSSTRDVVEDDLPSDQRLVDLGEHRLKDLPRPERVFQLIVEGLPHAFPALKTMGATSFEGRESELAEAAVEELAAGWRRPRRRGFIVEPEQYRGPASERVRSRSRLLVAALAVVLLAAGGAALAALALRDEPSAGPSTIRPNSVGVIDPETGRLAAEIPVGEAPKGIAVTADAVWVANSADSSVTRIDPERRVSLRTIPLDGRPSDIAVDGNVWVVHNQEPATPRDPYVGSAVVSEIDSDLNFVVRKIPVGQGFGNIFLDPIEAHRDAVWVGGYTGVSRIDPRTRAVGVRVPLHGVADLHLRNGELWAAYVGGGIAHIDASGTTVLDDVSLSSTVAPVGLAEANGSFWVVAINETSTGTLFRVDPKSREVISRSRIGGMPVAVAAGFGSVWVADAESRAVLRIDPKTNGVVARIPLGGSPSAIATGAGAIWVTVRTG